MRVLTTNKQEQALKHLANIYKASFEDGFMERIGAITNEMFELAKIVGDEASAIRLIDKICVRMKGADDDE